MNEAMDKMAIVLSVYVFIALMVLSGLSLLLGEIGYRKRLERFKAKPDERPVLTRDVFKLPDCPKWARYAAVDEDGRAHVFEYKPKSWTCCWRSNGESQYIGDYRTMDWENDCVVKLTAEIIVERIFWYMPVVFLFAAACLLGSFGIASLVIAVCQIVKEF